MAAEPSAIASEDAIKSPPTPPGRPQIPQDAPAGKRAGRGKLVWIGLASVGLLALLGVVITAISSSTSSTSSTSSPASAASSASQLSENQLRPGDCLTGSDMALGTNRNWPDLVTAVPCARRHLAEIFFAANAWPQSRAYPGNKAIFKQGFRHCVRAFRPYDGIPYSASALDIDYVFPSGGSDWRSGDRLLVCMADLSGSPMYGSIKGNYQ